MGDVPCEVENILHSDQTDVGLGQEGTGETVTGDLDGFVPGLLDSLGAQGVVAAGDGNGPAFHDRLTQNGGFLHLLSLLKERDFFVDPSR